MLVFSRNACARSRKSRGQYREEVWVVSANLAGRLSKDAAHQAEMLPIEDFDFDLPPSLIAKRPIVPRDAARLLEIGDGLHDLVVRDLPALLHPNDILVFNDTRVIEARLSGIRHADAPGTNAPRAMRASKSRFIRMRAGASGAPSCGRPSG